jgi:hypothetical protein
MDKVDAIRIALTKGMSADDIRMVYNKMTNTANEWTKALRKVSEV